MPVSGVETMEYIRCFLLIVLTVFMANGGLLFASNHNLTPVTCHIPFETMDFLLDDISARYEEPSLEQRNLTLIQGKFGKALLNANVFCYEESEKIT